jgi:ATP-dependent DNA helicase RecG
VHLLLSTATPIPRTLALTLYGDLDLTLIRDFPPGRGRTRTRWLHRPEKRKRLIPFLRERLTAGERVYWVCPRLGGDEGEETGYGEVGRAESAERRHAALARGPLAEFGLDLVHGRQPRLDRNRRLTRFRSGRVRLLVATTVIEVGVDVPEATVMVIEGAERLGLAQLHQLRGRVGRGTEDAWCFLLAEEVAGERMRILERETSGFVIAEEDLRLRGMGDLAGVRQAGPDAEGLSEDESNLDLLFLARDLVREDPALLAHLVERIDGKVHPRGVSSSDSGG